MAGPVVIEILRGREVECRHEVDVVAVDPNGRHVLAHGEPSRSVLPRSAVKPIQAVPVAAVESDHARLALAASSHAGEPVHIDPLRGWLAELGLSVDDLECGIHPPTHRASADALAAAGDEPSALHNTCSGKHVGFLAVCLAHDLASGGYLSVEHPLQRDHITPALVQWCDVDPRADLAGVDGCGIPVWAMPLDRLAGGWARLANDSRGTAIFDAMVARPQLVAGSGRACTRLIETGAGRVVAKTGAEGVYVGLDRTERIAVAVKARDGATRASAIAVEWALARLGALPEPDPVVLHNWAGTEVGQIRVVS